MRATFIGVLLSQVPAVLTLAVLAPALSRSHAPKEPPENFIDQGAAPTPLQLFQKLLPVVRHPRCANCHGGVDARTGQNHPPGAIDSARQPCVDCHSDAPDWGPPAPEHFFINKSDRELCGLFADFASKQGSPLFISNHLRGDELIKMAFAGEAAGARTDPPDRPGMEQEEFISKAKDWIERGQAACEVEGTITVEETVDTTEVWHPTPEIDNRVEQHGKRTVTINLRPDGNYQATTSVEGSIVQTQVMHARNAQGDSCAVTMVTKAVYTGHGSGLATVVAKDTAFFADTDPSKGQTDYRLDVKLPRETIHIVNSGTTDDGCAHRLGSPDGDEEDQPVPPSSFTLEGHLDAPSNKNLVGSCDKMVKSADIKSLQIERSFTCNRFRNMGNREPPWIMHHGAAASFHDGSDVPFRVVTHWNLRYRK